MTVDFSRLVLNPAMLTFGRTVTIDPLWSQPGQPPYQARGVFSSDPFPIVGLDGQVLSDQKTTLGIRLADWGGAPAPAPRDTITISFEGQTATWYVSNCEEDGQGGSMLTLRYTTPVPDPRRPTQDVDIE
jgi:hypothetical protein